MKKTDLFSSIVKLWGGRALAPMAVALVTVPIVSLVGEGSQAQDEPNPRVEKRFHNIYRKFNKAPTSNTKWEEALGKTGDSSYTIQKGDTLWDISETFFGDPYFWPKIWSVNSQIQNPHEILPKGVVQFVPGTAGEPPAMGLADKKEEVKPETAVAQETGKPDDDEEGVDLMPNAPKQKIRFKEEIDFSKIQIPPPAKPSRPLANLPNSLPPYIYYRDAVKDAEMEINQIVRQDAPQPLLVHFFASDSNPNSMGEVVEIESGSPGAAEGTTVLIRGDNVTPGMRLMVFETIGSIRDGNGKANRVQGQLEVLNVVNSSREVYRARVVKSLAMVTVGANLANEELPVAVPADSGGQMTPVAAKIIGGEFNVGRNIFGPYNVVYLSAGAGGGIQAGSHIPVYRNPNVRIPNSLIAENPAEIGELQVVRVDNDVATAIVLRSLEDIRVGDVTSPAIQ